MAPAAPVVAPDSLAARAAAGSALSLRGLTRLYGIGAAPAVAGLDLDLAPGEFVTLLGASGSGKTTTLMMVAGVTAPDAGAVLLDGRPIHHLPPERRGIGVVFQSYALFPHLAALRNVAFPCGCAAPRAARHGRGRRRRWSGSDSPSLATGCRASSPAGSSSAWRLRARWSSSPDCC
jgi:ABC-type branched-subunit amino acid transport system ATPase component